MQRRGSDTNAAAFWRHMFSNWPEQRPRRGLIITAWLEHIPFDDYLMSEAVLFISRPQPDGLNARKVMLPFDQIVAVKFPDVFELEVFEPVGFRKKFEATSHAAGANGDERDGAGSVADADAEVHTADQLARGLDAEVVDVNLDAPLSARGEVSLSGLAQLEQHVFGDALDVQAEGPDAGERRDAPSVVKGEAG